MSSGTEKTAIIGKPIVPLQDLDIEEKDVSLWTETSFLPAILVDIGFLKSK